MGEMWLNVADTVLAFVVVSKIIATAENAGCLLHMLDECEAIRNNFATE